MRYEIMQVTQNNSNVSQLKELWESSIVNCIFLHSPPSTNISELHFMPIQVVAIYLNYISGDVKIIDFPLNNTFYYVKLHCTRDSYLQNFTDQQSYFKFILYLY